ncbi:MAG: zinc ribbon domain-containing protein [Elusimicrobia bacterium]|nr:zinc ribbon domain-containing protein [Elusimicrobiota bacterium]
MKCPNCQAEVADQATECPNCFIVFYKWKQAQRSRAQAASDQPAGVQRPVGDVTVKCYGFIELTKGGYLFLQTLTFLMIIAGLVSAYYISDATLQSFMPSGGEPGLSVGQVRRYMKIFWWVGAVYESIEAWVILGRFREKEEALSRPT